MTDRDRRDRADGPVIAVDAMGGDRAPGEIVAGALAAAASSTSTSCSSARRGARRRTCPAVPPGRRRGARPRPRSSRWTTSPRAAVRTKKDSSLVRCAEAVRDGRAARDGRRGQHRRDDGRRAAAHGPHPGRAPARDRRAGAGPGQRRAELLVDGGATVDPEPEWLVQWALLGREYATVRLGVDEPTVALLSNGEEAGQGRRAAQAGVRAARRREGLHRQRRRPRPDERGRRRDRHRRLHRQRRAEDARRRDARPRGPRVRRRRRAGVGRTSPTR